MTVAAVGAVRDAMETQRKKPLRTYSKKRPFSETQTTDKRRKTSPTIQQEPSPAAEETAAPEPELPRLPAPAHSSSFEKGSILNYFKPCRSSSSADSSMLKKLASSSPPISLDRNPPPRAPRRLQLRPPAPLLTGFDDDDESDSGSAIQPRTTHPGTLQRNALPSDDSTASTETDASDDIFSRSLSTSHEAPRIVSMNPQKKPVRTKSAPVQTTLNLSTKSTFEECKLCRIVYNPLHPPDVKFHAKQHKANLRNLTRG